MTPRRCVLCGRPLGNEAAHVPTPELRGFGDLEVYWCLEAERHVVVPLPWLEDLKRSARSLRSRLGGQA